MYKSLKYSHNFYNSYSIILLFFGKKAYRWVWFAKHSWIIDIDEHGDDYITYRDGDEIDKHIWKQDELEISVKVCWGNFSNSKILKGFQKAEQIVCLCLKC